MPRHESKNKISPENSVLFNGGDNTLEGVPGAAGADKELDETQLCSSKYEIRSHGEILLIFFTLLLVKFIAA